MARLEVDVWSDVTCPWCATGKRNLEEAIAAFARGDEVEVTWHAFELDPAGRATFDAHRLLKHAAVHGRQAEMLERMLRGHEAGEPVDDPETLTRMAIDAALQAGPVRVTLASGRYAAEGRADARTAERLGITGVPYFVLARRFGVAGAQSADALLEGLERAYAEAAA
jgi:predicted DsbA family dithiol-disulfide isomerase